MLGLTIIDNELKKILAIKYHENYVNRFDDISDRFNVIKDGRESQTSQ